MKHNTIYPNRKGFKIRSNTNNFENDSFDAPEIWYELERGKENEVNASEFKFIEMLPGLGYIHAVTEEEIRERLSLLPEKFLLPLEVIQLSPTTRKRKFFPYYGMQWEPTIYLYPFEESLVETYNELPKPQRVIFTRMYGGKWKQRGNLWELCWTQKTLKDFYLNNILIHEIGHLNDERNTKDNDRERFANHFAIKYGYNGNGRKPKKIKKRHHKV